MAILTETSSIGLILKISHEAASPVVSLFTAKHVEFAVAPTGTTHETQYSHLSSRRRCSSCCPGGLQNWIIIVIVVVVVVNGLRVC